MIRNVASISEVGLYRKVNQDEVLAVHTEDAGLFAVADGMGGHDRGELASRTAAAFLLRWWKGIESCIFSMPFMDIVEELEKRIEEMNEYIFQMYRENGQCGGTTLCVLFIRGDAYAVMNIGDSRIYKSEGRRCLQITKDDVWENQLYIRQTMGEAEIRKNPFYGKLVQALGSDANISISIQTGTIKKRTCFLLCSDGIYKYCERQWFLSQLRKIRKEKDVARFVRKIREAVYGNGAKDNLSMIVIMLNRRWL